MPTRFDTRERLFGAAQYGRVGQWMNRSMIRSIQRGVISITAATSATATITSVDVNNSVLRYLGRTYNANGSIVKSLVLLTFTNATTITASVNTSPGVDTCTASFEVIEYWPGWIKSIQRGTGVSSPATATITAVNVNKTQVDWLGCQDTTVATNFAADTNVTLTNATTLTFGYGSNTTFQTIGYQVVEWY